MRRPFSLLVGTLVALAFGALLLAGCESGDGGGNGDSGGVTPDVAAGDTAGGGDGSGTTDTGATADTGCVANCGARACGPDGCGGSCGSCSGNFTCSEAGTCVCEPQCDGLTCGPDPRCGFSCGECAFCTVCDAGACVAGGDLSCVGYFVGLQHCEAGDNDCPVDCRTAVVAAAGDLADRVKECFDTTCDHCAGDVDCLRECGGAVCGQDYLDCFASDATCYDVYTCVDACLRTTTYGTAEGDACRADCIAQGTPDAQTDYLALELCIREEGDCDPADMAAYEACERRARNMSCPAQTADCPQD